MPPGDLAHAAKCPLIRVSAGQRPVFSRAGGREGRSSPLRYTFEPALSRSHRSAPRPARTSTDRAHVVGSAAKDSYETELA